jgi:hypothetical protein
MLYIIVVFGNNSFQYKEIRVVIDYMFHKVSDFEVVISVSNRFCFGLFNL